MFIEWKKASDEAEMHLKLYNKPGGDPPEATFIIYIQSVIPTIQLD